MAKSESRVELYEGKDGWRWRLKAANNEVLAFSQSYSSKNSATRSAAKLADGLRIPLTEKPSKKKKSC